VSLQTRLTDLINAIGADMKTKVAGSGTTKITVSTTQPATGPDGEIWIQK